MKFSDDSIFVAGDLAIEKLMQTDQTQFNNEKVIFTESVGTYNLIDLKKDQFKDLGASLRNETKKIPWQDLKNKILGLNFYYGWYRNESYVESRVVYKGKEISRVDFISSDSKIKYELYLDQQASSSRQPVFFFGIEDKFKASLVKMKAVFPNNQGVIVVTREYIKLKEHEVLKKIADIRRE